MRITYLLLDLEIFIVWSRRILALSNIRSEWYSMTIQFVYLARIPQKKVYLDVLDMLLQLGRKKNIVHESLGIEWRCNCYVVKLTRDYRLPHIETAWLYL